MSDTLGPLMQRNLLDVFGQPDSARPRSSRSTLRTARSLNRGNGSLAATLSTRGSNVFSRKLPDLCSARQRLPR